MIEPERLEDERGFFARTFCAEEFLRHGLNPALHQCSISFNHKAGTLRGIHYQAEPFVEAKLVSCRHGAIYDVAVDLRRNSPTYLSHFGEELNSHNRRMLYVGEGIGHGFQTLTDGAEVFYQISAPFHVEASRGVRWDDPAFSISWPDAEKRIISERDRKFQDYVP